MADTRVQLVVEDWVRREWLPRKYEQQFRRERLRLTAGGVFDFDAVSADDTIVVNISTSNATTSGARGAAAKMQKLRADMFFLLMISAQRRLIVLTEKDMFDRCEREKKSGRVPAEIEFVHAALPSDLVELLKEARILASSEVSPRKGEIEL